MFSTVGDGDRKGIFPTPSNCKLEVDWFSDVLILFQNHATEYFVLLPTWVIQCSEKQLEEHVTVA